jgi:endopeptidase La
MNKYQLLNKTIGSKLISCIKFKRYWDTKLNNYYSILENISKNLEQNYKNGLIVYNIYIRLIQDILEISQSIELQYRQSKIFVSFISQIKRMTQLLWIERHIKNISLKVGFYQLNPGFKFLYQEFSLNQYSQQFKEIFNFIENYFITSEINIYYKKQGSYRYYKLDNETNKINIKNEICLDSSKLDKPSFCAIHIINKNFIINRNGCIINIPIPNTPYLIRLTGYFYSKSVCNYNQYKWLLFKLERLKQLKLNVDKDFALNYIENIPLRELLVNSVNKIGILIKSYYTKIKKLRDKTISKTVKDFLISDLNEQYEIIYLLLIDNKNTISETRAYLLVDLISNKNELNNSSTNYNKIYTTLPWKLKILLKKSLKKIDSIIKKYNMSEQEIPYEKRIFMMKCDDNVKNKAMVKLKEVNNSKGEGHAKAEQYLDALLKIPFGTYKKDIIKHYVEDLNTSIQYLIDSYKEYTGKNKYIDKNIELLSFLDTDEVNSPKKIKKYYNKYLQHMQQVFIEMNGHKQLHNITKKRGLEILKNIGFTIPKSRSKAKVIEMLEEHKEKIISYYFKSSNNDLHTYLDNILMKEDQCKTIMVQHRNTYEKWELMTNAISDYIGNCQKMLDKATFGMIDAKNEIIRILGQWITGSNDGYILGFEGPPGIGKTTLAKLGISKCLQDENGQSRPFVFIPLGGSSNGSTLEGHNYTYVGSTYGKIVEALIETQCMNPIIYIDELDKVSKTEHGREIIGILTHMTDSSQNAEFVDKYFSGIKLDISKCLIIFSYNNPENIDRILLDRIHRIPLRSLDKDSKINIINDYLLPEICQTVGFERSDIVLKDEIIEYLIDTYTMEAGVRKLKQRVFDIIRELNIRQLLNNNSEQIEITKELVDEIFERNRKVDLQKINLLPQVGIINGLYATAMGNGGITVIEVVDEYNSSFLNLHLTGSQGDIMQESMNVAKTLAWKLLTKEQREKLIENKTYGIHIHCPAGATPKDGPSAGTAITTAIYSLFTGRKIKNNMAITGEINLQGKVTKIGGLESKIDGAKAAGVNIVLCPKENSEDLRLIRKRKTPPECETFKVVLIETIQDVLELILCD